MTRRKPPPRQQPKPEPIRAIYTFGPRPAAADDAPPGAADPVPAWTHDFPAASFYAARAEARAYFRVDCVSKLIFVGMTDPVKPSEAKVEAAE